jgi:hypothetical protein
MRAEVDPMSSRASSIQTEDERLAIDGGDDIEGVGSIDVAGSDHMAHKLVRALTSILRAR